MNTMVDRGFAQLKPKGYLIDELQHTCEGNREITARHSTDWIKVRMDLHNLAVIGAGTSTIERLNDINPQFTSRMSATYALAPFPFGDGFRQILASYRQMVTAVDMGIIVGPESRHIHDATKANQRSIKRLLMYSAMHASNRSDRKMILEDLALGFANACGERATRVNPFVPGN